MFHIGFVYTMPTETYPIWTMHSHHRRGAASPRYRNRAKITVRMCAQKPCPVRFSCPRKICDPYDSVNRLSCRKCRHYWPAGIFSPTDEWGRRTTNRYLYRTLFLNDMVTIFYPQFYHSSTVFSKLNQLANESHTGNQFAFNYIYYSFTF